MEKEIYGPDSNDKARRTSLKTSLLKSLIRNESPEIDSLLTATSNKQKAEVLQNIKELMSPDEFSALKAKLVKYKVVSQSLLNTIR